jgi:hypothetical protein
MKAPQKIVLPGEVMASSIVRLAAHLPGQAEGSECVTEKFSQGQIPTIIGKLSIEEITWAFDVRLTPKILIVFLSYSDKIW